MMTSPADKATDYVRRLVERLRGIYRIPTGRVM